MKKINRVFLGLICFLMVRGIIAGDGQLAGVQPLNVTIPSLGSRGINDLINRWIGSGLTNLSSTRFSAISDRDLFANIDANKSFLEPNLEGVFEPNWDALVKAIQNGNFNSLHFMRMLISEYLVGRMVIAASPLNGSPLFKDDSTSTTMIQEFLSNGTIKLQQLRYARNAFTTPSVSQLINVNNPAGASTSGWGNPHAGGSTDSYSNSLNSLDTFAGLIIINNTDYRFGDQNRSIAPKTTGFFPAQEFADKWQSTPVGSKWGKRRMINFKIENNSAQGSISVYQETNVSLPNIYFGDPSSVAETVFDNSLKSAFFQDVHPWAVVVEVGDTGGSIKGLAKLNVMDFPNALSFSKTSTATDTTSVSLADLWNIPMTLYNATIASVDEAANQSYPLAAWMLQALFNGYLQTSFYKAVVPASIDKIAWKDRWSTPTSADWFKAPSPLDWKFLRMLLVTYSANLAMYIKTDALPHIKEILANPTASNANIWYVGATDTYVPVIPVKL